MALWSGDVVKLPGELKKKKMPVYWFRHKKFRHFRSYLLVSPFYRNTFRHSLQGRTKMTFFSLF